MLFSYFRSSCSWRIRTILNLKKIDYIICPINLLLNEQNSPEYERINPNKQVPTLYINGHYLSESMAIAEFLEEFYPKNIVKLLPTDPFKRAEIRRICETVNAGLQPLQNLQVLKYLESEYKGDKMAWAKRWNEVGLKKLDELLLETIGKHAVGDEISLADVFIVPHFMNAVARFGINADEFPNVKKVTDNLKSHEAFIKAFPENQIDFK